MSQTTITLFGATGKIGIEVLQLLSDAKVNTRAVTRNTQKAVSLPYINWVEADMNDPVSLEPTIDAGQCLFLLSPMSEHMVRQQINVIEVARRKAAAHIVKLSSGAVDVNASQPIARAHGQIEAALHHSDLNWTMLRPNGFMQNWLGELAHTVRHERTIYETTGDGKRAFIDLRDIAAVAYTILTQPREHRHKAYFLTGGEAVSYRQLANCIARTIGQPVTYIDLEPDQARQRMAQKGMPSWLIDTVLAYAQEQRNGQADVVSDAVPLILAKPARTMEAFIAEHARQFV
ncbi:NmrA family NAD(P)-binding protein [uncultured Spirosoma sp.]|uniref:NmrA family NAD(P)-binding protein n=1 Tax=uncultured Spirosoma sp. TaxID=278208 RepID=UPI00258CD1F2|nr:NmrA family NAD(P)-binding protein [uncultured Spirosoma sp.]